MEKWAEIKAKGDFPLQRLSYYYFDEREANLIQAVHKVFWLVVVRTTRVPVAFEGTPLELWCMFNIAFSESLCEIKKYISEIFQSTGDRVFPDQYTERDFNMASFQWKDPSAQENIATVIFKKICRPGLEASAGLSTIDYANIEKIWAETSLENFERVIQKMAPMAAQFGEFPLRSSSQEMFTDDEINVIQINYSIIIWNQLLNHDMLMMPAPSILAPNHTEICLLAYILYFQIRLKANKRNEYYALLNAIIFHMHYPFETTPDGQIILNSIYLSANFLYPGRDKLMEKISTRSRNRWTTMMLRHDRSKTPFKKLPLDIFREIDNMAFGKRLSLQSRPWLAGSLSST